MVFFRVLLVNHLNRLVCHILSFDNYFAMLLAGIFLPLVVIV